MEAELLFTMIPTGRNNALTRPDDQYVDRKLRRMISQANKNGDCIINTGDGSGYYRPDHNDPIDMMELNHYFASELHRAREILFKRRKMKEAINGNR